jgi:hypothetical protein
MADLAIDPKYLSVDTIKLPLAHLTINFPKSLDSQSDRRD